MNLRNQTFFSRISTLTLLVTVVGLTDMRDAHSYDEIIFPYRLMERTGTANYSDIGSLAGIADNEIANFYPGKRGFNGVFLFEFPDGLVPVDVISLSLQTTYRGPERPDQRWVWQLRDFRDKKWVTLGDNADTMPNQWVELEFQAGGDLSRFVSEFNKLKVRYFTKTSFGPSDLDSLGLQIDTSSSTDNPEQPPSTPEQPPSAPGQPNIRPGTTWQIQLTGTVDTSFEAQLYDIDLFDVPADTIAMLGAQGRTVICYFSAGSWENWRPDADQFPNSVKGRSNGWPGEKWLDIRNIEALAPIMIARMNLAVEKGCDGVDPDNVDGWANNTGFPVTYDHQLAFNRFLAREAHARGLLIGLKNNLEQIEDLVGDFDFAVNEECFQYNECDLLGPFFDSNKAVFGIEYSGSAASFCPEANRMGFDFQKKRMDLDAWRIDCRDY